MKNNYKFLDSGTFELVDLNLIVVDDRLAKTISLLSKKGYLIEMYNLASIWRPFAISDLIYNLVNEKLLNADNNIDKIKKVIKNDDYESTIIVFKDKYKFDTLPNGYELKENTLYYNLSILKNTDDITFKSLVELDHELTRSINDLENWAQKLPEIV